MSFWKLVAAVIVGNLLTGLVAMALWLFFIASLLGNYSTAAGRNAGMLANGGYRTAQPAQTEDDPATASYNDCLQNASDENAAENCDQPFSAQIRR